MPDASGGPRLDYVGHLLLALAIQALVYAICRNGLAGAVAAAAWVISREITQAEYRWIERFGGGLRANMPWWGGLDPRVWQKADPWIDWIGPTLVAFAIALLLRSNQARRELEAGQRLDSWAAARLGKGSMHAFIIEDDYLIAQSLCDMLEPLGFNRFSFARSEDAAVMGAGSQPIDLITADVRLLPGDGVSAVNAICEKRDIPVIYITAYADELIDRVPNALVVQKPIDEHDLAVAVAKAVPAPRDPV